MTKKEPTRAQILEFADSIRGRYIIGQCLAIGSQVLLDRGEVSNASDAELLGRLFEPFYQLEMDKEEIEAHFRDRAEEMKKS